jgi:hypothetical protein
MSLEHIDEILGDGLLSASTRQWLRQGFAAHVRFNEPLPNALNLDAYPRGLPDAFKHKRRKEYLFEALKLLDDGRCSIHSIAKTLSGDLIRLASRSRPRSDYERLLCEVLDAHPSASLEPSAIWLLVREYRQFNFKS